MHYNGPFGSLMEVEGASTFIFLSQKSWIDDERWNLIAFHNQPVAISVSFSFSLSVPFIIFALLVLLPPGRNSDPGSHSRLFSPLSTAVHALHVYREKRSAIASLVYSRQIVPTHAIIGALHSSWCHLRNKNYLRAEIRTHDINAIQVILFLLPSENVSYMIWSDINRICIL